MTWERYTPTDEDRAFCEGRDRLHGEDRRAIRARADGIEPYSGITQKQWRAIRWIMEQDDAGNSKPFDEWVEQAPGYIFRDIGDNGALSYLCDIIGSRRAARLQHKVALEIWRRETGGER